MAERRFRRKAEMALSSLPCVASRRHGRFEEHNQACFIVKDAAGQALAYVYFEEEPGRHSAVKLLAKASPLRLIRYVWSSTPLFERTNK